MAPRWFRLLLAVKGIVCRCRDHDRARITECEGQTVAIRVVCLRCGTTLDENVRTAKFPSARGVLPTIERDAA